MRELLQQALDALKTRWNGGRVDIDDVFHSKQTFDEAAMQSAQEAMEAALSRSKLVKVADGLPVVPEGSDYVCIWCWKEGALRTPWVSRWYGGFSANAEYFTHWQYHIANTPAPPEDL